MSKISDRSQLFALLASSYKWPFCLYQHNKYSESKVKFIQVSDHYKRVLEPAKVAYANKTKESNTTQKICSWYFWKIANIVLNKS